MAKKEACPKCSGIQFSVAKDKSNKHYCQTKGCGNIWVPGLVEVKRPDVLIRKLQEENNKLAAEVNTLRKQNGELKARLGVQEDEAKEIFT